MPTAVSTSHPPARHVKQKLSIKDATAESILASLTLSEKVFLLSGTSFTRTSGLTKHGLHAAKTSDAATDVRGDTVFGPAGSLVIPNATSLASTWDEELICTAGALMGREARWKEVDVLLAPTLNLHRDPRGGRNQESFGEDPFLAGKIGAAFAKGVQSEGVAVCVKHLVCNDSETDRRTYNSIVDEETLRDVYLRPFEILVEEANPAAIMTSYNSINGAPGASNKHVMDIVRSEWGWKGIFMSDWFGTYDGIASIKAGCDLEMPFPAARGVRLLDALQTGIITEAEVDHSCMRIIRFLSSVSARPQRDRKEDRASPQCKTDVAIARSLAAGGIVVLQNNGVLPLSLKSSERVAVIGAHATTRVLSHLIMPAYTVSPLDGVREALSPHGRSPLYCHGPYVHRVPPTIDHRYSTDISFHLWNAGDRVKGRAPALTRKRNEALEALLLTQVPGLGEDYEIEMTATITVPVSGSYILSIIATAQSEITLDGVPIYSYDPSARIDIQQFLFYSHEFSQTVSIDLQVNHSYSLQVVTRKQMQTGPEPVAQGMIIGMIFDRRREDLVAEALDVAGKADKVVLFVGTTSEWEMEGIDREDIELPCDQADFVRQVLKVNPHVIVVNQSGAAVDLSCARSSAAVVHAHFGGQEAGHAIADVLFGKVNPSGRTTYTWPATLKDAPSFANFPRNTDQEIVYAEGLATGYKGYRKLEKEVLYPFGHGSSYTTFVWSECEVRLIEENTYEICVAVTNTGGCLGREVVQVYVQKPDEDAWQSSLEAFAKTPNLTAGQSVIVRCRIGARAFKRWDGATGKQSVVQGRHILHISRSSVSAVFRRAIDIP